MHLLLASFINNLQTAQVCTIEKVRLGVDCDVLHCVCSIIVCYCTAHVCDSYVIMGCTYIRCMHACNHSVFSDRCTVTLSSFMRSIFS